MRIRTTLILSCLPLLGTIPQALAQRPAPMPAAGSVASPDGHLQMQVWLDEHGMPHYSLRRDQRAVIETSALGLVRDDADFTRNLKLTGISAPEAVHDHYEILTAKRRVNDYAAQRRVFSFADRAGHAMDLIVQMSDDGVAFRYRFPDRDTHTHRILSEATSFHFDDQAHAWMQPVAVARTGWKHSNPSYEEYYKMDVPVGTTSPSPAGWVFPALFHTADDWVLLSESGLQRGDAATRLQPQSKDGVYRIGFADPREVFTGGALLPQHSLPWQTQWRVIVVGSLKTVADSMLGVDVAPAPTEAADQTIQPGHAAWSWPLLGDQHIDFDTQKRFIDYAHEMGWRYVLVDNYWDTQIGFDKLQQLIDYARPLGIGILVWYNSAGAWNDTPQTPRNQLLTHADRIRTFERLKAMGVAGLKIDFFGGDGESMIAYYLDILEDAAPFGFLINFHGATLPRGWQRTYPHLMTMEAVRGEEYVTFTQEGADQEPSHAAMLPFARNVFDPMDFTPMVLDKLPGKVQRRTTAAFELALPVIFTSGITHFAETPEGMAKAPEAVRDWLRRLPAVWDDSQLLDGYPGKFAVFARKGDGRWEIAGINAESTPRTLKLDLSSLGISGPGLLIHDGDGPLGLSSRTLAADQVQQLNLTLPARGGFVLEVTAAHPAP